MYFFIFLFIIILQNLKWPMLRMASMGKFGIKMKKKETSFMILGQTVN